MTDANNNHPPVSRRGQAEPFFDCIARLLVKRWRQDQQENSVKDGLGAPSGRARTPEFNGNVVEE